MPRQIDVQQLALGDAVLALRDAQRNRPPSSDLYTNDLTFQARLEIYAQLKGFEHPEALKVIQGYYNDLVNTREAALLEQDLYCAMQQARPDYAKVRPGRQSAMDNRAQSAYGAYGNTLAAIGRRADGTPESIIALHRAECRTCRGLAEADS